MAETTTIARPAPYLEAAGQTYLDLLTKRTGQAPTAAELQAMSPQISGQNVFTQQAQQQFNADAARQLQAQQANQQAGQGAAQLQSQVGLGGLQAGLQASKDQAMAAAAEQTANLERLKTQAASEGDKQALQQKINDLKYQTAMEQRDYEKKQIEFYNAILRGSTGLASTQIQYAPAPSAASQLGGLGLGALGLSKAFS